VSCIVCANRWVPYVARAAGATKVASLGYGVSENSKQCAEANVASVEKYGADNGVEMAYVNDELAFALPNGIGPEVTAMKEAGVDFIAGCLDLNAMKSLAQELQRQGMLESTTLFHANTYDANFVQEAGDLFEGDYVMASFRPFEADPGSSQMNQFVEWMGKSGHAINELAMNGWINADEAYQGILAAGPQFDRASVIAATNTFTEYTAGGLTQPIDFTRQHVPPTDDDAGRVAHGPKHDCIAVVTVTDGAFELVGDPAKPWSCWPGETDEWSEPVAMNFE
jgi:branched-chain amino acid transport system substrate-binding protein